MRINLNDYLTMILAAIIIIVTAFQCSGCSPNSEAEKWELQSYQLFAKNLSMLMEIDSLESELDRCRSGGFRKFLESQSKPFADTILTVDYGGVK